MATTENSIETLRSAGLETVDPEIARLLDAELDRQRDELELIASENFTWPAVMEAVGSVATNKYAEGYPGKRYYGGCDVVDEIEGLAIERAKALYGADHANVQPHAGAQANMAAYLALLQPGDTVLALRLDHGGHLTHGHPVNSSSKYYDFVHYGVSPETGLIDMEDVARQAHEHKPALIVTGASAYPRTLDFAAFRAIADEVGARFMVDMAHISGLVAGGEHPSPVPHADVVTSTVHKSLAGPRAGFILCTEEWAKKVDSGLFPGLQGGPLCHGVAGKAVAFGIAQTPAFRDYQRQIRRNAQALAAALLEHGQKLVSGGTDTHLVLLDLQDSPFSGKEAEDRLHSIHITVNRNSIPFDPRPAMETSGVRSGTPAATMRGLDEADFSEVGRIIARAVTADADLDALRGEIDAILARRPLYAGLRGFSANHAE
ncbi:MAG: serine hydroxymethyltransferase [Actinomycetota bacterium]